jgi:eukaryotic-like serine/threonine-protein kinase
MQAQDALVGPASAPAPVEEEPSGDSGHGRRKVVAVALSIGAVVVAGAVVAYAVNQPQPSVTAAGAPSTTARTTSATTTPAPTTTTEFQHLPDECADDQPPWDDPAIATILDFCRLVPDDLEAAWGLLSAHYRASYPAEGVKRPDGVDGFASFQQYWGGLTGLELGHINPRRSDGNVSAVATYHSERGTMSWSVNIGTVQEDGRWKISYWSNIGP